MNKKKVMETPGALVISGGGKFDIFEISAR